MIPSPGHDDNAVTDRLVVDADVVDDGGGGDGGGDDDDDTMVMALTMMMMRMRCWPCR